MKNLIALIVIGILILLFPAKAQTVKIDGSGNYIAVKTTKTDTANYKANGKTFTDTKGNVYPVFVSTKGKEFYLRTSKTGIQYKAYIKLN